MASLGMPKKNNDEVGDVPVNNGQKRSPNQRYLLQVDRQTKSSFAAMEDAERAGRAIKKDHPNIKVSIYDSLETTNTTIEQQP